MNQSIQLMCSSYYQHVVQPLSQELPCGENLDYNPAFILLQSRLQPKLDAEYGSFVEAAEPVNWTETEHDCLALLQKSKDIRLIVILMRCRLRKTGLPALAEGLELLSALLRTWPDELYPQLLDEGEYAPMLRANAFAELEDIHGLLADLRGQLLPKAAGLQINVREFEKAYQIPREEGALSEAAVAAMVHEWLTNAREAIVPMTQAHFFLQEIKETLSVMLGEDAPEFSVLGKILSLFAREFGSETPTIAPVIETEPAAMTGNPPSVVEAVAPAVEASLPAIIPDSSLSQRGIHSRADALHRLQEVRSWFAMTEPSSPLIPLLKYAERSVGKNFSELLTMYPPEFIATMNNEKE